MKVELEVVPTQGSANTSQVEVDATGASVGEVLRKAGVDPKNKDLAVDGKPAQLNTHVGPSQKLTVRVTVTERVRGS